MAKGEPRAKQRYAAGEERVKRILNVAADHFARFGYAGTSIAKIAKAADLTDAGLLHHFPSKELLLKEVLAHRSRPYVERGLLDAGSVRELLTSLITVTAETARQPDLLRYQTLVHAESGREGSPAKDRYRQDLLRSLQAFVPVIERAIADGEVRPEVDARLTILQILALLEGLRMQAVALPGEFDLPRALTLSFDGLMRLISTDGQGLAPNEP